LPTKQTWQDWLVWLSISSVKKPDKLHGEHLWTIRTPMLILQGERDPLASREGGGHKLSKAVQVKWIADGDHSFKPRKSSGGERNRIGRASGGDREVHQCSWRTAVTYLSGCSSTSLHAAARALARLWNSHCWRSIIGAGGERPFLAGVASQRLAVGPHGTSSLWLSDRNSICDPRMSCSIARTTSTSPKTGQRYQETR